MLERGGGLTVRYQLLHPLQLLHPRHPLHPLQLPQSLAAVSATAIRKFSADFSQLLPFLFFLVERFEVAAAAALRLVAAAASLTDFVAGAVTRVLMLNNG